MSMAKSKEEEDEVARTDGLEIISIGCLYKGPWDKKYWSCSRGKDRYPYPIGYQAVRAHGGNRCKIEVHEGSKGPLFMVTAADGHSCSGQTPNIAWDRFQKKGFSRTKIWHGKRFSCKIGGTEFFGFKDPLVQRLLRELVANVDGIAELNMVASSFCNGPSLTEQVLRCPNSCSYPDLRACLVEPRTTRKRSRRLENTSTRSSSEVRSKRLQTTVLENAKDSNPGGSQWKHNSVSSCIYSASSGDKIICGSSEILSKQMNSNIVTEYDGVQAADEKNLESPEDHKSTGLTRYVSTAEESLDRLRDGTTRGLSYSVGIEHNIEEPPFVKDPAVNVRDIPLCVLDTYDSLEVDNIDRSHDLGAILGKTSLNSQGLVAANQNSDFGGLIVESHPGGEMDKGPLNCSSENSDLNSVSRDVAKSMMTVLLPQALPLLKEASRKKSEAKQCVIDAGHLLGAVEFEEKNPGSFVNVLSTDLAEYENARVEKEENMPVLTTDSASIIRSSKNSNAIAPDSFEDKPNFTNISGTQSIFHLDQRHVFSSEKIQGERAHSRNIFHHRSLDLPHEWANMSTDLFLFDESLVAASDCISDGYNYGRTNHKADAKAGLGNNDCAMIECKSLLTGKSECPSEGNLCRIFRNDCSAERCTSAGDFLCQEINDEPGYSDIAKGFTIGQSNNLPTVMPTTNVKDDTNEDPTGSQVQASVCALVKKNISSFPSSQPSIDEKPGSSLPSLMSAPVTLDSMKDTAKKDKTAPQLKSSGNMYLNNEQESIYKLVGCYIHPFPIVAVWLCTHENEIYICILSGLEKDKVKTLFLYKVPTEHAGAGCPSFLGHTQVTFSIPQKIYGGQIVPERSYLQFTPHGKGLVFLGCVEAPCCRERRISCSCSTCASVSFNENAIRIVQVNMGYVTLVANLKAIERLHSILVCEPDYLVAIGVSGRMHLWAMNPAWSAETEEFDIPTNDCVSPCIVELKKIPRHAYLVVGHNGFGEFSLWDVSKRIFLSKFSHPYPSICSFLPISLSRWRRQDFISGNRSLEEHVDEIMEATAKSFSGHDVNHAFLPLEEEDIALWLLVAAVSEVEHDYQSNARRTDSVVGWRLALLAEKMVVLGNTLDPRAASVGVLSGQGIIATNEGYVYMWELSTGKRLGTLHRFPGGSVSCIATNDSTPAVFAAAGDGGKLLVYRHSQFKAIDREMMQP